MARRRCSSKCDGVEIGAFVVSIRVQRLCLHSGAADGQHFGKTSSFSALLIGV